MTLTPAQKATLKAAIQASPDTNALLVDGNLSGLVELLNTESAPPFWVWRPSVSRQEIYTAQNDLPVSGQQTGFWNWTTYKGQAVAEQNAWVQMFMGDQANFAAQNVRDGISAIFTGSATAAAQRDHCLAIGRRKASRVEKVFATGAGSTAAPGVMGLEGPLPVPASLSDLVG